MRTSTNNDHADSPTGSSGSGASRSNATWVLAGAALAVAALGAAAWFLLQPPESLEPSMPTAPNGEVSAAIAPLLSGPVQFEHALHAGRYGAQTVGRGYLDISNGCTIDSAYSGPIYQVEMRHVDGITWQRSFKQPTGMRGNWGQLGPLAGSVNSVLASLSGSPSSVLCSLGDLPLVLRPAGSGFTPDWSSVLGLEQESRSRELARSLVDAGWEEQDVDSRLARLSWKLDDGLLLAKTVQFEPSGLDSGRVVVLDEAGVVLEELIYWPTAREDVSAPAPSASNLARAALAEAVVGPPPVS